MHSTDNLRFQMACKRAFEATLELVSKVSAFSVEELENRYKHACASGMFGKGGCLDAMGELDPDELDEIHDRENVSENPCFDLLNQIRQETAVLNDEAELPEAEDEDAELKGVPHEDEVKVLVNAAPAKEPFQTEAVSPKKPPRKDDPDALPSTLSEVIAMSGNFWNRLFRFSVMLRCGHGCDGGFIKNHLAGRRLSRGLNWHQPPGCITPGTCRD